MPSTALIRFVDSITKGSKYEVQFIYLLTQDDDLIEIVWV